MPEDLCVCVWNCRCTWDELYIPELVTMNACMNACTAVVLCCTVAVLYALIYIGASKVDNSHTHHSTYGFCTVIVCTIGLHVPIGVMACTLIKLPLRTLYIYCLFSPLSLCAGWRICPSDCCPQRAPRRGQGPHSSVPRLAHGE